MLILSSPFNGHTHFLKATFSLLFLILNLVAKFFFPCPCTHINLFSRSNGLICLHFGLSERVLASRRNPLKTKVNANYIDNQLSASQETNYIVIKITRRLMLFNKQNCCLLRESYERKNRLHFMREIQTYLTLNLAYIGLY